MEKIVYVLGAGFSAPLGLPVMANFLERAKDQFAEKPTEFPHFEKVFETIDRLSVSKNYYNADLFNIEEILSILEMDDQLEGNSRRDEFVTFIRDVIKYRTPPLQSLPTDKPLIQLLGQGSWTMYGAFTAAVLNCSFNMTRSGSSYHWTRAGRAQSGITYSIVTLNYDLIPETSASQMQKMSGIPIGFTIDHSVLGDGYRAVLAKLHGSVDGGNLIPPTWSKHLTDKTINAHWKAAHKALREATQIRILGYSLPIADSYVKYLFKSAIIGTKNLKHIDVLCRSGDGSLEKRFKEFIIFHKFRFQGADIQQYLNDHCSRYDPDSAEKFDSLETTHGAFFR
jgi:hypothetical protein